MEQDLPSPIPAGSDRGMNGGGGQHQVGAGGKGKEGGTGLPSAHSLSSLPSPPPPLPPPLEGGPDVADLLREDVPMLQIF